MKTWIPITFIIVTVLMLSSIPYFEGYQEPIPGFRFMGLTHNIDDACVYLSWIRQIADGAVFIRNQFTLAPQDHLQFNVLFLILGWVSRLLSIPPVAVYHAARLVFGAGLILMIYHFSELFLKRRDQRLSLLIIIAFSAGFGWLIAQGPGGATPVDMWQPEAITFLSMYLNPLFLCAQILMLCSFMFLIRARAGGRYRDAVLAGLILLLLANIHTYDVVTVAVVWAAFLAADAILAKRIETRTVVLSAMAGMIASPALIYQFFLYRSEDVFRMRVNTSALSPPLWAFIAGFGLIAVLAAFGLAIAIRRRQDLLFPAIWAVVGFAVPYLPLAQQRKLLMGIHIPLAILAVLTLTWLSDKRNRPLTILALGVTLLAFPSNLLFMAQDVCMLHRNQTAALVRPQLSNSELSGMRWLRSNTARSDGTLMPPDIACFLPALVGNAVYFGHWSETPDYYGKLAEYRDFADRATSDAARMHFLISSGVEYVWWDGNMQEIPSADPQMPPVPVFRPEESTYLRRVFGADNVRIYRVSAEAVDTEAE